ncbi:hypothetical protein BIT28_23905 [Photobacterium proteolyticum]|uniref:Uncharacterized protein n=1 Tax=Photobacterium proteolyticum TaxID=1903952 RepID=A0A1Q9GBR5_9GAMM|nr:hypothetical protein [Photobacterium proteolyticum]OLQ71711.1 hypothetical protein BIT28_23905 [Photobacterium proteolyticum]
MKGGRLRLRARSEKNTENNGVKPRITHPGFLSFGLLTRPLETFRNGIVLSGNVVAAVESVRTLLSIRLATYLELFHFIGQEECVKYKYLFYGLVAISALAMTNLYLWRQDAAVREIPEAAETGKTNGQPQPKTVSENFEYPAPVKQLQQVLAKSYQPPVHEGEDIFPDGLLNADDETSVPVEAKKEMDDLRARIEAMSLAPQGES